jgi:mRNA interferase RelE/StbE
MNVRFELIFLPDAAKEYQKLDNSQLVAVNKSLTELVERADQIGKPLSNRGKVRLAGCKEIKLREYGIRIIFRITSRQAEILKVVIIAAIGKRAGNEVFNAAGRRLENVEALGQILKPKE